MRRPVEEVAIPCPVCRLARLSVEFLPAGRDYGDPAELVDVDGAGSGPFCECYESDLVDQAAYNAKVLQAALEAHHG